MGGLFSPPSFPTPTVLPPPPAANPVTYANAGTEATAGGAARRMQMAAGAGFGDTVLTGSQGAAAGATAESKLSGIAPLGG